jgi:uncharacterized protein YndB with AHSA1/START domain
VERGAVVRSVVLRASVEVVWQTLTEAGHLSAWLGGDVEVDAHPGGQLVLREDGRLRRAVVVDVEPLRHLEIRWLPDSHRVGFVWEPDEEPAGSSGGVEFILEALATGTRLTVVECPSAIVRV